MTGENLIIALKRIKKPKRIPHLLNVSSGKIGSADRTAEKRISRKNRIISNIANAAVGMTGSMKNAKAGFAVGNYFSGIIDIEECREAVEL